MGPQTEACPWEQASVSIPHFVNLVLLVAVLGKVTLMGKAVSITLVSSSLVNKSDQIQNVSDQAKARVILKQIEKTKSAKLANINILNY